MNCCREAVFVLARNAGGFLAQMVPAGESALPTAARIARSMAPGRLAEAEWCCVSATSPQSATWPSEPPWTEGEPA